MVSPSHGGPFKCFTFVHLTKITIQEENLSKKVEFEEWAAIFGVEINRYHADNGIFSEQPFRLEIDDSNQKITFFGVGSQYQNPSADRRIQTLTLETRTLLLHEKIYWIERTTTILWTYEMKDFSEQLNEL